MEYFYSKQDLDTFTNKELALLANYYRVSSDNRNDFLWLLAMFIITGKRGEYQYAEMPQHKAWNIYNTDLLKKFVLDPSAPQNADKLPTEMINADPTPTKKYLEWIINSYLNDGIKRFEDIIGRTKIALQEYTYLLKKKLIKNKFQVNIDSFCGLSGCVRNEKVKQGLDAFLDEYEDDLAEMRKAKAVGIAEQDIVKIYEDSELTIITPLTQEASCKYGAGTKWCTAAREGNAFEHYTEQGPLYILIPIKPQHDKEKYQLQIESGQVMDEKDNEISYSELKRRFPSIKNVAELKLFDFLRAIEQGDDKTVQLLLGDPAIDPSTKNNIAIRMATNMYYWKRDDEIHGHLNTVKLLLADKRINPAVYNNEIFSDAIYDENYDIIKLLLADERIDPHICKPGIGICPIIHIIAWKQPDMIKLLLNNTRFDPSLIIYKLSQLLIDCLQPNGDPCDVEKLLLNDDRVRLSLIKYRSVWGDFYGRPDTIKWLQN